MTSNEYTIHYKISLLDYARNENVTKACRAFKISIIRYIEIARYFEKYRISGLIPKPKCPKMPNKIAGITEKAILDLTLEYPTNVSARLANELKEKTSGRLSYSLAGIYFVLKVNRLNRKRDRFYRSYFSTNSPVTLEAIRKIEAKSQIHVKTNHLEELLSQDFFYLGTIKTIGRIYSQAVRLFLL